MSNGIVRDPNLPDWWDTNYEDLLEWLQDWATQTGDPRNLGEQAYQRSEQAAQEGLNWDYLDALEPLQMWRHYGNRYHTGGGFQDGVPDFDYGRWMGDLIAGAERRQGGESAHPSAAPGEMWDKLGSLIGYGMQEQGIKSPIHTGRMQTPFRAGGLTLDQLRTGMGGLQGFRGQDIQLLLEQLRMEMMAAQARAAAAGEPEGGGCVVTSACMESKNLPDDCRELQTLRKLRDWMKGNLDDGNKLVAEYEGLAPAIVKAINDRPDAKTVWSRIYDKFIKPAVDLVEQGNNKVAVKVYKDGILELAHDYL